MGNEPEPGVMPAAEFIATMLRLLTKVTENVSQQAVSQSALLSAALEKYPELAEPYERYRRAAETSSPFAIASRQIVAELKQFAQRAATELNRKKNE